MFAGHQLIINFQISGNIYKSSCFSNLTRYNKYIRLRKPKYNNRGYSMPIELTQSSAIEYENIIYGNLTPAMAADYLRNGQIIIRSSSTMCFTVMILI